MNVRAAICFCGAMLCSVTLVPNVALAQAKPEASVPAGDLAFARFIALIRGHLLAGDELVQKRQWNAAYPHFAFPTEEIYGVIRDDLRAYHTPPFDGSLKALARTIRARNAAQYPRSLEKVEAALAAADAALNLRQPDQPRFAVAVAVEVLKTAAEEYEDAVANGRIVHPIGYRTARGFVLQADRMIESAALQLPASDAASLAEIRTGLALIKQAFVRLNTPERSALDEKALFAAVKRVEQAAGKLTPGRQI
jgi:hypothetical protein